MDIRTKFWFLYITKLTGFSRDNKYSCHWMYRRRNEFRFPRCKNQKWTDNSHIWRRWLKGPVFSPKKGLSTNCRLSKKYNLVKIREKPLKAHYRRLCSWAFICKGIYQNRKRTRLGHSQRLGKWRNLRVRNQPVLRRPLPWKARP